jgi:hypothetical protein
LTADAQEAFSPRSLKLTGRRTQRFTNDRQVIEEPDLDQFVGLEFLPAPAGALLAILDRGECISDS